MLKKETPMVVKSLQPSVPGDAIASPMVAPKEPGLMTPSTTRFPGFIQRMNGLRDSLRSASKKAAPSKSRTTNRLFQKWSHDQNTPTGATLVTQTNSRSSRTNTVQIRPNLTTSLYTKPVLNLRTVLCGHGPSHNTHNRSTLTNRNH